MLLIVHLTSNMLINMFLVVGWLILGLIGFIVLKLLYEDTMKSASKLYYYTVLIFCLIGGAFSFLFSVILDIYQINKDNNHV